MYCTWQRGRPDCEGDPSESWTKNTIVVNENTKRGERARNITDFRQLKFIPVIKIIVLVSVNIFQLPVEPSACIKNLATTALKGRGDEKNPYQG
jgi:hypothetical protein